MPPRRRKRHEKPVISTQKPISEGSAPTSAANMSSWIRRQPVWILLSISSGACAAINGVFAKLTTTSLTSTLASSLSRILGAKEDNVVVNVLLRSTFFGLNVLFNIAMWALFTAALTRNNSTTRVSIVNVSANFFITAILGALIFGEKLPFFWWLGAALLATGNVIIGRREEGEKPGGSIGLDETQREAQESENLLTNEQDNAVDEDLLELDDIMDEEHE